jgi:hypothetical protein
MLYCSAEPRRLGSARTVPVWGIALLLVASAIALTACQTSGETVMPRYGAPARYDPSPEETEHAARLLDEEFFDRLKDDILIRLMAACADEVSAPSRTQCVNEAILTGFDETGEARRRCAYADDRIVCYMFGSYGYDLARRQQPDLSAEYDWQDPLASLKSTLHAIGDQSLALCRYHGSTARVERCVLEQFGAALSLSREQVLTCVGMGDAKTAFNCELRSHLEKAFEATMMRMENNKGVRT